VDAAELLYELQELDLKIEAGGTKLTAERARIQEPPSIRQARALIQSTEAKMSSLEKELRATEQEAASVTAKKNAVHSKLYGGGVSVPRELAALEAEEAGLAKTLSQLEDRELDLMGASEDAEKALAAAQRELESQLAQWQDAGNEAHKHIDELEAEIESLKADRTELAAKVSPTNLATYERLRPRKGGHAVAQVKNNMCQACRVNLPSGDVQRARGADPPSVCENCGRLLFVA
jgi:predicted  nucleic acid-binding Zn-ribbon protein